MSSCCREAELELLLRYGSELLVSRGMTLRTAVYIGVRDTVRPGHNHEPVAQYPSFHSCAIAAGTSLDAALSLTT